MIETRRIHVAPLMGVDIVSIVNEGLGHSSYPLDLGAGSAPAE